MTEAREKLHLKKLERNQNVLARYNELRESKSFKESLTAIMQEFDLGESTVRNILYLKTYSNSPLQNTAISAA